MQPFHLLLVSLRPDWRDSLTDSLRSSGYVLKLKEVADKKEALKACNHARYDALVTSCSLPDGSPNDLVLVLGSAMPCLVLRDGCHPGPSVGTATFANQLPPPVHQPDAWLAMLESTIRQWEGTLAARMDKDRHSEYLFFHKVAELCLSELHSASEKSIENVLRIVLGVLEVSRVYIREEPSDHHRSSRFTHEISASGQAAWFGPQGSVHEVLLSECNGHRRYLGVEDALRRRNWNPRETRLVDTVATLLKAPRQEKQHCASGWLIGHPGSGPLYRAS